MVSIIVPVYNIKEYLLRCVESLVGQSFGDLEILLVNDGSTDGSGELCDQLAQTDSRIRVIHKKNGGLSDARNAGLDAAEGEWILFVDGDDYLVHDAVERLLELTSEDVDFVQFFYHETADTNWQPPRDQQANPQIVTDPVQMWRWRYQKGGVGASSCTKLWNQRIFRGVRFRKGIIHEDEELLNQVLPKCRKVVYTDLTLYGYVMRSGSIVNSGFRKSRMDIFPILQERLEILESLDCRELVMETWCWQFHSATQLYYSARRSGFREDAAWLKKKLLELAKKPGLPLCGQYKPLYKLSKITSVAPALYYLLRRVTGKT